MKPDLWDRIEDVVLIVVLTLMVVLTMAGTILFVLSVHSIQIQLGG